MTPSSTDDGLLGVLRRAKSEGLLGQGPVEDHIAHARGMIAAIPEQAESFVDLGSGGGVPGLVIALDRPALSGALLDGSTRRGIFLSTAVNALGFAGRIQVLADRAEKVGRSVKWRGQIDVVVARSFGPPAVVAECAAPLLTIGGTLIVSDPPSEQPGGTRWPTEGLAVFGLRVVERHMGTPAYTVLEQVEASPDRFPRRVGIPAKRPLF